MPGGTRLREGRLAALRNYLADSNEQICVLLNVPDIDFNVYGLGLVNTRA